MTALLESRQNTIWQKKMLFPKVRLHLPTIDNLTFLEKRMIRDKRWPDYLLPLGIIACLLVIFLPLPTVLMDMLLAANLSLAVGAVARSITSMVDASRAPRIASISPRAPFTNLSGTSTATGIWN